VDRLDAAKKYDRITLIGHSLGAMLARKLYVCACGESGDAPLASETSSEVECELAREAAQPRPWAARVDRIILMAALNRGWSISHHLSIVNAVQWTIGKWIAGWFLAITGKEPLIMAIHRGAPFLTQIRLQWLALARRASADLKFTLAPTVQLLGSVDDMVSPEDNIDLVSGNDFIYLDVPMSGHTNVIEMDDTEAGQMRREVLTRALDSDLEDLRYTTLQPGDYQLLPNVRIQHVIFVIHGIRDEGFWTQKIARKVMDRWRRSNTGTERNFASVTSTYGYFPMLPFILPSMRREKVQWLMDQYTEARARYPNAKFYYIGHSNGTYLLARALKDNPSCHFERIVFAGSVVRTDFDWALLQRPRVLVGGGITTPQVGEVANYVATEDWVVAFFPKAMEMVGLQDLGSAGHDGFVQIGGAAKGVQVTYVRGDHSAALKEEHWDDIAHFIINGTVPDDIAHFIASCDDPIKAENLFKHKQSKWVRQIGKVAPAVWVLILVITAFIGWGIAYGVEDPFWRGIVLVGYFWSLYKILTNF
jgi:pimeloyl-ACP methyl ester carboxylesterase